MNLLLIGQPNVGKSSIFNILTNSDLNIIHPLEGATRDWHFLSLKNFPDIKIFDSPGFQIKNNKLNANEFQLLFNQIDIFLYVVDYKNYKNLNDKDAINYLRKFNKEIILIINKNDKMEQIYNFEKYGIKNYFYLSCSHRLGFSDLNKFINKYQKSKLTNFKVDFSVSIYGKPNAGKSTILNKILGFNRSSTSKFAGTTSDIVIDTFKYKKKYFQIYDTAGIGKKSKTKKESINYLAIKKSIDNIREANLNLLIIDSLEGLDRQSKRIYNMLIKSTSLIIIFNKIDLIKNKKKFYLEINNQIKNNISAAKNLSLIFISALKNKDIACLKSLIYTKSNLQILKIPTHRINIWLKKVISEYPHPLINGKKVNFKYATQIKSKPITIKIFCNFSSKIKKNYKTYLLNEFTIKFKIVDMPVKFIFSSAKNPYA